LGIPIIIDAAVSAIVPADHEDASAEPVFRCDASQTIKPLLSSLSPPSLIGISWLQQCSFRTKATASAETCEGKSSRANSTEPRA